MITQLAYLLAIQGGSESNLRYVYEQCNPPIPWSKLIRGEMISPATGNLLVKYQFRDKDWFISARMSPAINLISIEFSKKGPNSEGSNRVTKPITLANVYANIDEHFRLSYPGQPVTKPVATANSLRVTPMYKGYHVSGGNGLEMTGGNGRISTLHLVWGAKFEPLPKNMLSEKKLFELASKLTKGTNIRGSFLWDRPGFGMRTLKLMYATTSNRGSMLGTPVFVDVQTGKQIKKKSRLPLRPRI
jgi:hypothetical protein